MSVCAHIKAGGPCLTNPTVPLNKHCDSCKRAHKMLCGTSATEVGTSAPMDPERLADFREILADPEPGFGFPFQSYARELLADRDHWEKQVQELLAVIHGDGGHYSERVGIAQSLADAHDALPTLRAELTESNDEMRRKRKEWGMFRDAHLTMLDAHLVLQDKLTESNRERDEARRELERATKLTMAGAIFVDPGELP